MNPPFRLSFDEVGRLSDEQLFAVYSQPRNEPGMPRLVMPAAPVTKKTDHDHFVSHCWFNGVTDPAMVAALWAEHNSKAAKK